ncbi:H-NS family nucleoid-associated regulatory protein [Gymnodinialimonas ceratoperidinii]|uniref:H-NS histone family protein n=1 Tax=Gymnodinialimonas ceratoperidinii TaxID=2856823 RepID=A0A8F6YAC8_9RHOB|nr:H-NS histone family protein [Gymnodinialimonas ceratoperidinii]QXT39443.1 H-NS histone family protein [Gymnodinialimonas ceratoperidinii]
MTKAELGNLSIEELKKLQKDAAEAIATFENRKRADAIAELKAVAQKHGYKLEDLVGGKGTKVARPPKYRHPNNPAMTWSGRGRQPNWIKDALGTGKSLDDFAI